MSHVDTTRLIHQPSWKGNSANLAITEFSEVQHSRVPLPGALGPGRGVFPPKCKHLFAERTSMIAHIYPSVLQAVSGRRYAGCLETGAFRGTGVRLCRILTMNFGELLFHALG